MGHPLVSIIVPIFNTENYLERCIQSLLKQSYKQIEVLLVNDGSNDNSGSICNRYSIVDERVRVIHKRNGGLSDARNVGIEASAGEYLSFVDSDDYVHEGYIERMLQTALDNDCAVVQCSFIAGTSNVFPRFDGKGRVDIYDNVDVFYRRSLKITAWAKLYRREVFSGLRFPMGKIHEDEFVTYRAIYASKQIALLTQPFYYYYQTAQSIMRTHRTEPRLDFIEAYAERILFFSGHKKPDLVIISRKELAIRAILYFAKYQSATKGTKQWLLSIFKDNYNEVRVSRLLSPIERLLFWAFAVCPSVAGRVIALRKQ